MAAHRTVRIALPHAAYDIAIGRGVLDELGERMAYLFNARRAFLIHDDRLPPALTQRVLARLGDAGFGVTSAPLAACESRKTLDTAAALLHELARAGLERGDPVIALGGGLTGDVAGFVAATYKRGCPFVQCPTTLLSMVDASVGGKTGVNVVLEDGLRKNLVGAFHQPALVLADLDALDSLPDRQVRSGLGECLKHGLISGGVDAGLWEWTIANLPELLTRDGRLVGELIERGVRVKAHYVTSDERETDAGSDASRMILNLGHTFAHALEGVEGLTPHDALAASDPAPRLLHGEAVAYGLVAAAATARELGLLSEGDRQAIEAGVTGLGLALPVGGRCAPAEFIRLMGHDKKAAGGRLRLVLPVSIGRCRVVSGPAPQAVEAGLKRVIASE